MKRRWIQPFRDRALSLRNRRRIRYAVGNGGSSEDLPVFFIFTEDLVHFAPFCLPIDVPGVRPVVLLNGVSVSDTEWMGRLFKDIPMVSLWTSVSGNRQSMLPHAAVIDDLFATINRPFCIQDPDCFVANPQFYASVDLNKKEHFAAGPFTKKPTDHDHILPDTFFILFNPEVFYEAKRSYGVSAAVTRSLPAKAAKKVERLGYRDGQFPEQFKGYFDTLQAFWLLSLADGWRFKNLPGENRDIYHIGGTSYLKNSDLDLGHWDYWPLSVRYFNLRLLEREGGERFSARFNHLFQEHGSAGQLLREYPAFRKSDRYHQISEILANFSDQGMG